MSHPSAPTRTNEWIAYAESCYAKGQDILRRASTHAHKGNDPEFVATLLLIRTLSNFNGVLVLARSYMVVEARILTRCCFENLFTVYALKEQRKSFVEQMIRDQEANRKARGEFLLEHVIPEDPELQTFLRGLPKLKNQVLNPRNVAAAGPVEKGYAFYALLSADAAHPGLDALNRYVRPAPDGSLQVSIEPLTDKDEMIETVNLACEAMFGVCSAIADFFNLGPDACLANLIDAMRQRSRPADPV